MLDDVFKSLNERFPNNLVITLMYEYFVKVWNSLDDDIKEQLLENLKTIREVRVDNFNNYKDGVLTVGGCDKNVYIVCNILISLGHKNVFEDVQEEFMQLAYTRLMSVLVAMDDSETYRDVKEYQDGRLTFLYTWDCKYNYLEDYMKRLKRLYEKSCKVKVEEAFGKGDFFSRYFEQLSQEEKRELLVFLVRIFKFIKAYNSEELNYRNMREYYYAWGNLQKMEKLRKIKPSNFLTLEKKLD